MLYSLHGIKVQVVKMSFMRTMVVTSDASSTRRGLNKNRHLVVSTIVTYPHLLLLKNNDCRENLRNVIKDNNRKNYIKK